MSVILLCCSTLKVSGIRDSEPTRCYASHKKQCHSLDSELFALPRLRRLSESCPMSLDNHQLWHSQTALGLRHLAASIACAASRRRDAVIIHLIVKDQNVRWLKTLLLSLPQASNPGVSTIITVLLTGLPSAPSTFGHSTLYQILLLSETCLPSL